jgi:DNA-binding NarL/FixJ family response regulator
MEGRDIHPLSAGDSLAPIRVLLADDHALMRRGVVQLLSAEADIEVVGEAATGREGLEYARELCPDVIVMDVSMPDMNGIEATRRVLQEAPKTRIIGLSMHEMDGSREAMLRAGAVAYVTKNASPAELLAAIRGEPYP